MTPRWKWDFEDEPGERGARPAPAGPHPGRDSASLARFRRRRSAAALVVVLALIAIVIALSSSHREASSSTASSPALSAREALARASHPNEPERDANAAVSSVL